ncbi:nascent polypeptide-associated complex subunit alpha, muscle-specific form-like [Eschrichtius robustus]|uniref:nascent polypeptide-associated complex subunit alpha, muscle-specific form-like n=1 Tax=Eschrichtius robustus TaxID=9764 RepID=UPI0035BFBC1E
METDPSPTLQKGQAALPTPLGLTPMPGGIRACEKRPCLPVHSPRISALSRPLPTLSATPPPLTPQHSPGSPTAAVATCGRGPPRPLPEAPASASPTPFPSGPPEEELPPHTSPPRSCFLPFTCPAERLPNNDGTYFKGPPGPWLWKLCARAGSLPVSLGAVGTRRWADGRSGDTPTVEAACASGGCSPSLAPPPRPPRPSAPAALPWKPGTPSSGRPPETPRLLERPPKPQSEPALSCPHAVTTLSVCARRPRQRRGRVLPTGTTSSRAPAPEPVPRKEALSRQLAPKHSGNPTPHFTQKSPNCQPLLPADTLFSRRGAPSRGCAQLPPPDCTQRSWTGHPGAPGGRMRGAPLCRVPRGPLPPGRPVPTASLLSLQPQRPRSRAHHPSAARSCSPGEPTPMTVPGTQRVAGLTLWQQRRVCARPERWTAPQGSALTPAPLPCRPRRAALTPNTARGVPGVKS